MVDEDEEVDEKQKMAMIQFKIWNTRSHPESPLSVQTNQNACLFMTTITQSKSDTLIQMNITTHAMYVECNTEARLRNHCCRGKAISAT